MTYKPPARMRSSSVLVKNGHSCQGTAQSQRARIAHEHLGRMLVIEEEAQAGPGQGRAEDSEMGIA